MKTYTCNTCGQTKTEPIDALDAKDNTVTYTGATSKDYDGNVIALESSKITRNGDGTITFMYKKSSEGDSSYTATAPKDAGTYSVKISVAATPEWKAAETVVEYTINKIVLPITSLTMPYEVLPEATGTGIASYKSKVFTSADGLPEGVTITVFPYNEKDDGTFTVAFSSTMPVTYKFLGYTDDSELLSALEDAHSNDPNIFIAHVDLGPNYIITTDNIVAKLNVQPKEITGEIFGFKVYDGVAYLEIMGTDLVENGVYEADKNDVKIRLTVEDANAGSEKTVISAATYYTSNNKENYNYVISSDVSYYLEIEQKKLTVPNLLGPVLQDSSGSAIDLRVVEIDSQYGAVEKFTITLRSSSMNWNISNYAEWFYSKTHDSDATSYYEMDDQYSKNYSLLRVFLNINKAPSDYSLLTIGQENKTLESVYKKFVTNAGQKFLVQISNPELPYTVTDSTGRILAPDSNGYFTPVLDGVIFLTISNNQGGSTFKYKVSTAPSV